MVERLTPAIDRELRLLCAEEAEDNGLGCARHDLVDMQQLAEMLAPAVGLSFFERQRAVGA